MLLEHRYRKWIGGGLNATWLVILRLKNMNPHLFLPPQSTLLRLFKGQAKMSDELPQALRWWCVFFFKRGHLICHRNLIWNLKLLNPWFSSSSPSSAHFQILWWWGLCWWWWICIACPRGAQRKMGERLGSRSPRKKKKDTIDNQLW